LARAGGADNWASRRRCGRERADQLASPARCLLERIVACLASPGLDTPRSVAAVSIVRSR